MRIRTPGMRTIGFIGMLCTLSWTCLLPEEGAAEERLHRHSLIRRPSAIEQPAPAPAATPVIPQRLSLVVPLRPEAPGRSMPPLVNPPAPGTPPSPSSLPPTGARHP